MSEDAQLETIIEQTIDSALTTIPGYLEEIEQRKDIFKVDNTKEFVFGIVMGMALGMGGAILSAQKQAPTPEDQYKVRDIVYKKIPQIREHVFK